MIDEIIFLTTNQVTAINTVQIRLYSPKEPVGVKDPGLLDSAINRPKQTVFGNDAEPSIYEKAAAYLNRLLKIAHSTTQINEQLLLHLLYSWKLIIIDGQWEYKKNKTLL